MANRKVLINYHTSGSSAPNAANVYQGEIVVAHETGKETLFTKNNANEMVPFISCAQTISIVSGMIEGADVVYDVQKKAGESFINVETANTEGHKTFTLSTSGVASDADLNALSAGTVNKFENVANILSALTDVVVTGISGDDIITATEGPTPATTGSNTYTITHKTGHESTGFNKLATDAYGHVTASTAVTTADIQDLGFKTSAETKADLDALSASVVANEAHISELSAGTQHDITALSAGTLQLSADTYAAINQLSGYAHGEIAELSGAVKANETDIDNLSAATLDLSAVTLTGVSLNNTPLTVTDHVVSVPVTVSGSGIANATESGSVADAIAVKEYVENLISSAVEYKGATGATPASATKGDLYIASGDFTLPGGANVETGDFIIYDGTKWDVVEKNLDGAITGNLTQGTVVLGDSTNSVKSLANGANGTVLTMVDGAPAWANDPELTVVSAGTGNVVSDITVSDHEITFTKGVTAANDADLQALSGVVGDFSGATDAKFTELSAYAKDVDDKVKALSAGTIQLSADTKAAIEQLSGFAHNSMIARDDAVFISAKTYADEKVAAEIALLDSSTAVTAGKYITGIAIADGKISGITEESLPANVVITATTATPVNTASAVLTGVTASGTDNHELTFGMSNKVFSASTSDSAVTSQSAQTSVSANMAYELSSAATISSGQVRDLENVIKNIKVNSASTADSATNATSATVATDAVHASAAAKVDSALTLTDVVGTNNVVFDGSANKTVTFGTATSITNENSMTMSDAGVVDVNVIDCGEY